MRVLLVGEGPLPEEDPSQLGFPQLRTSWFLRAMRRGGHEVLHARPEAAAEARRGFKPEAVVSAGPFAPARAAALAVEDEPLLVDVPGDPFAEARAKADHGPDPHAEYLAAWGPALARADAFLAVSDAQARALLGQLGLLGRLGGALPEHRWVEVVPAAYDFGPLHEGRPRGPGKVVALAGGFNTWLDADGILEALLARMGEDPEVRAIVTGGAISGHHSATWERFQARVKASPHADRFQLHGWVPHGRLPKLLAGAHVGVTADRPGPEADLGTRTRILFYAHQGLSVVASPRGDLAQLLAREGLIRPFDGHFEAPPAADLQAWLRRNAALERVTEPLLRWLENPTRTTKVDDPLAGLAAELQRAREELAAVHASPTWRIAARLRRILRASFTGGRSGS